MGDLTTARPQPQTTGNDSGKLQSPSELQSGIGGFRHLVYPEGFCLNPGSDGSPTVNYSPQLSNIAVNVEVPVGRSTATLSVPIEFRDGLNKDALGLDVRRTPTPSPYESQQIVVSIHGKGNQSGGIAIIPIEVTTPLFDGTDPSHVVAKLTFSRAENGDILLEKRFAPEPDGDVRVRVFNLSERADAMVRRESPNEDKVALARLDVAPMPEDVRSLGRIWRTIDPLNGLKQYSVKAAPIPSTSQSMLTVTSTDDLPLSRLPSLGVELSLEAGIITFPKDPNPANRPGYQIPPESTEIQLAPDQWEKSVKITVMQSIGQNRQNNNATGTDVISIEHRIKVSNGTVQSMVAHVNAGGFEVSEPFTLGSAPNPNSLYSLVVNAIRRGYQFSYSYEGVSGKNVLEIKDPRGHNPYTFYSDSHSPPAGLREYLKILPK